MLHTNRVLRHFTAAILALLGFWFTLSSTSVAGVVFYTGTAAFDAAEPGLPVETFNPNLSGQSDALEYAPISNATNDSIFGAGSILPGISISDSGEPQPGGQHGLIVFANGVGDNYFGQSVILNFSPGVTAVGATIFGTTSPGSSIAADFTETVYSGSTVLSSTNFSDTAGQYPYIGVSSTVPITSIRILSTSAGDGDSISVVNNIAFGTPVPEPSAYFLVITAAALAILRRAFPLSGIARSAVRVKGRSNVEMVRRSERMRRTRGPA